MRVDRDLWAASAAAVVCALVSLVVPVTAIRTIFVLPLCFFLPGYALTESAFARGRLGGRQTLALALALSLVTLVLGSLLLGADPGAVRAGPWALVLVLVVVGGCAVAAARRPGPLKQAWGPSALRVRGADGALLVVAGTIAIAAFVFSRTALPAPNAIGYTELWMLPTGSARSPGLAVGVSSQEQRQMTYRLEFQEGPRRMLSERRIVLTPGQHARIAVPLRRSTQASSTLLTAVLYLADSTTPYRTVTGRLPVQTSLAQ